MFEMLEEDVSTKDVAVTLKKLVPLFDVVNGQLKTLSIDSVSLNNVAGKGWVRYQCRVYKSICKKSVKNIRKKIPINIEMPTLKEVGNGQVLRVYDKRYKDKPVDPEIDCYSALEDVSSNAGLIEDNKD